ncbi:MAG TPA: GTP-binding protein [Terracidiphilus sp.]|jgi:Ni2+-binding GTPase involved in maturation of urease and hydrogenase
MSEHPHQPRPWIVILGGFLGSGKTSLILAAARLLEKRGLRCAVILNDQCSELVDTRHVEIEGVLAREVTGGCFCCRFSELQSMIGELRTRAVDVIFAEPVGSCTDISATVFRPLREEFDLYRVAPFTVLVDPKRAASLNNEDADSPLAFLFQKQLDEADLVCMTKADLYPDAASLPGVAQRFLSAKTGQGVSEWLDEILSGSYDAGKTTLEIDYEQYARAEAALAWMNLSFTFEPAVPVSPALASGPLFDGLHDALTEAGISIAHLKMINRSPTGWLKVAVCANGEEPAVEGNLDASPAGRHELLVNLRARGDAAQVRKLVEWQLQQLEGRKLDMHFNCFSPAAPKPERRVPRAMP